jgi:hypothetical protein
MVIMGWIIREISIMKAIIIKVQEKEKIMMNYPSEASLENDFRGIKLLNHLFLR